MDLKNWFQSKETKVILSGIGGLVVILLVFQAGMIVGYRKASFSYNFGEKYYRTFEGGRGGMMVGFMPRGLPDESGAAGTIVKIALPNITVADRSNIEKVVTVESDTIIRRFRDEVKAIDLKVGDEIIVIGEPDSTTSTIEARLIRVMPQGMVGATTTIK